MLWLSFGVIILTAMSLIIFDILSIAFLLALEIFIFLILSINELSKINEMFRLYVNGNDIRKSMKEAKIKMIRVKIDK